MSTNVYLAWAPELTVPLTIYAPNEAEARDTYAFWCAIHQPGWSREPAQITEVAVEWLKERPQLAAAVERAKRISMHDAVLLFHSHEGGWFAVEVHQQATGAIAPVEPIVRSFEVRSDFDGLVGREVMVFAFDLPNAIQIYLDYRESSCGPVTHSYTVTEFSRWTLTGDQTILRTMMDMGATGVAGWSSAKGWGIYPPCHDLAGN